MSLFTVTPEDTDEIVKYQARFNVGDFCPDCPVFDGLYEFCSLSAGGSIGKRLLPDNMSIS